MVTPSPILIPPWPAALATLALGAIAAGIAAVLLNEDGCTGELAEEPGEKISSEEPDIQRKLATLATMRNGQQISQEEYERTRAAVLNAFATQ